MKNIAEITDAANLLGRALQDPDAQEYLWGSTTSEAGTRAMFALLALAWVVELDPAPMNGILESIHHQLQEFDRFKEQTCQNPPPLGPSKSPTQPRPNSSPRPRSS